MNEELTDKDRKNILGNENIKCIYVFFDSPVCSYCARQQWNSPEWDQGMCDECIHQGGGLYKSFQSGENNFLGIQCIIWEE